MTATPDQEAEWVLQGYTPEGAENFLEWQIREATKKIAKLQVQLAQQHRNLKRIKTKDWPLDDSGRLILSNDNPLRY